MHTLKNSPDAWEGMEPKYKETKTRPIKKGTNDATQWLTDICMFLNEVGPCFQKIEIEGDTCVVTYIEHIQIDGRVRC